MNKQVYVKQILLIQVFRLNICYKFYIWLKEKPQCKIDKINPTEYGESSKKSHCATNGTKLAFQSYLHILFYLVTYSRVKVSLVSVALLLQLFLFLCLLSGGFWGDSEKFRKVSLGKDISDKKPCGDHSPMIQAFLKHVMPEGPQTLWGS